MTQDRLFTGDSHGYVESQGREHGQVSPSSVSSHLLTVTCHSEGRWPRADTATCRPPVPGGCLGVGILCRPPGTATR